MENINCTHCQKEMLIKKSRIKRGRKNFCSVSCRVNYKTKEAYCEKNCELCFTRFKSLIVRNQKFCSRQCLYASNVKRKKKSCLVCANTFTVIPSQEKRREVKYCSKECANIGMKKLETRQCSNKSCPNTTTRRPSSFNGQAFCSTKCRTQEYAPAWQGGKTPEGIRIRNSKEYAEWRKQVFERDNYTCQHCGDNTGGNLEADHIRPFAFYPELRLDVSNGRTLCRDCHKETPTYGSRALQAI